MPDTEVSAAEGVGLSEAWQELLDKNDRTSPEDYPDMVLITREELGQYMAASPTDAGGGWEGVNVRQIALDAMQRMRAAGESHVMCARWIAEDVARRRLSAPPVSDTAGEALRDTVREACLTFGLDYEDSESIAALSAPHAPSTGAGSGLTAEAWAEIDRVLALELSAWRRGYHWQNRAAFERLFHLTQFGPTEVLVRLIAAARRSPTDEATAEPGASAAGAGLTAAWAHAANEWADMATSGVQWLRNVKDGTSTVDDALANMAECLEHCQAVAAAARAQAAPASVGGGAIQDHRSPEAIAHGDRVIAAMHAPSPDAPAQHGAERGEGALRELEADLRRRSAAAHERAIAYGVGTEEAAVASGKAAGYSHAADMAGQQAALAQPPGDAMLREGATVTHALLGGRGRITDLELGAHVEWSDQSSCYVRLSALASAQSRETEVEG